jgi:S1-C subfamily serine protease
MANVIGVELSERLATLAKEGGKSVVRVDARRAPTSGVAWSPEGIVLTAHHGLETEEGIEVSLPDGRTVPAELVGRDPATDLAVLRIAEAGLAVPAWADGGLEVGNLLVGLTRPSRTVRASLGLLARAAEDWRTPAGGKLDRYLETDLPLHPGFSGGLVLDLGGRAVGLATAGLLRGTAMVVPVPTLRRVAAALLAHGRIRRGFLGIASFPVRLPGRAERQAGQEGGLLLTNVEEGSPADRAGLLLGDVLLSLGGEKVAHLSDLLPLLEEERIGAALPARVLRAGGLLDLSVTVGARERREGRGG